VPKSPTHIEQKIKEVAESISAEVNEEITVSAFVLRMIEAGYNLDKKSKKLVGRYNTMSYGGHEVQMMHPKAKLEIVGSHFHCFELV